MSLYSPPFQANKAHLYGAVGGYGANGQNCGDQDDVGNDEEQARLQDPGVAHYVPHAEEEKGGEH